MTRYNIKQIIQELANQNFNLYAENYKLENGQSTEEATMNAQEIAIGYYDNRNENEMERDEGLGITKIDYVEWVMEEYENFIQAQLEEI